MLLMAVDPATRENGCLQVIEGTHLLGRIDHVLTGEQAGADKERVAAILERFPLVYVEMDPGVAQHWHEHAISRIPALIKASHSRVTLLGPVDKPSVTLSIRTWNSI
jgi:DhnA family fructose-bisphosphate aldolase class Ia